MNPQVKRVIDTYNQELSLTNPHWGLLDRMWGELSEEDQSIVREYVDRYFIGDSFTAVQHWGGPGA